MRIQKGKGTHGFTIVELVVAMTILVVLTGMGFYSYTQNIVDARDSVRISDIASVSSQLKLYKKSRGAYPLPGNSFNILNRGRIVATQGVLNEDVTLTTLDKIPYDPSNEVAYSYSTTRNKQEFQLALTLESSETGTAVLEGDYKTVSINVLPTIMLAPLITGDKEINTASGGTSNRNLFIFNGGYHNLVYTHDGSGAAYNDGITFSGALNDPNIKFWQNSDFRSCSEILESGKQISNAGVSEEYQILDSSGVLSPTNCTF